MLVAVNQPVYTQPERWRLTEVKGEITWQLSEVEAVSMLDTLTDLLEVLDDDNDEDYTAARLKQWAGELTDLIRQKREYEALFQPELAGLA
jgi:hypothetical protein